MKSGFNASILSLFNFEDKKIKNFINQDSEVLITVDKSKIKSLIKNKNLLKAVAI